MLILPVGGLLVGYLSGKNRFLIAGVFFLFSLMALITFGTSLLQVSAVINLFLGSAAFLFLDSSWLDKWLITDLPDRSDNTLPLSSRLQYMADAIRSVREDTDAISAILPQEESTGDATREVCETVCGSCRNKLRCWETNYEDTLAGFRKMETHLSAAPPAIPQELEHCIRTERLRTLFPVTPPTGARHAFWRHALPRAARFSWNSWQPQRTCSPPPATSCTSATAANSVRPCAASCSTTVIPATPPQCTTPFPTGL